MNFVTAVYSSSAAVLVGLGVCSGAREAERQQAPMVFWLCTTKSEIRKYFYSSGSRDTTYEGEQGGGVGKFGFR